MPYVPLRNLLTGNQGYAQLLDKKNCKKETKEKS